MIPQKEQKMSETGQVKVFGQDPMTGFGTMVQPGDNPLYGLEMLQATGLDFTVSKVPLEGVLGSELGDTRIAIPEHVAMIRDDTRVPLGVVGHKYQPVQNAEVFGLLDDLVRDGSMIYESAGTLRGGRNVWAQARVNVFEPVSGDPVGLYIFLFTAHDGSSTIKGFCGSKRFVCMNMMRLMEMEAKGGGGFFSIRHTATAQDRLNQAMKIFETATRRFLAFEEFAKRLASFPMNLTTWRKFLDELIPVPEEDGRSKSLIEGQHENLTALFESGRGQEIAGVRGTGWAALNALTEYTTHERTTRGANDGIRAERRFEANMMGSGASFTQGGIRLLGSMVQAA